jgi:hypothetical protein
MPANENNLISSCPTANFATFLYKTEYIVEVQTLILVQ